MDERHRPSIQPTTTEDAVTTTRNDLDPAVIAAILAQQKATIDERNAFGKPIIKKKVKLPAEAGDIMFSSLFWEPEHIPDIPVKVYKPEDWPEPARVMIPTLQDNWQWPKQTTELFALAMYCNDTTLLYGMQGTGKSDLAKAYCAITCTPMWRQSCHEETREQHFIGTPSVTYTDDGQMRIVQEPTLLTDSIRYGGMFVEDEAFRHSAALVLQSLREKNTRTLILPDAPGRDSSERVLKADPHKWRYVLTDNTAGVGDVSGLFQAQVQDASTLDRITAAIKVDYLPDEQEQTLLKSSFPDLPNAFVNDMVRFANLVRTAFTTGNLPLTMSVRGLLSWGEKEILFNNPKLALQLAWFSKVPDDCQATVSDMYHQVFAQHLI